MRVVGELRRASQQQKLVTSVGIVASQAAYHRAVNHRKLLLETVRIGYEILLLSCRYGNSIQRYVALGGLRINFYNIIYIIDFRKMEFLRRYKHIEHIVQ